MAAGPLLATFRTMHTTLHTRHATFTRAITAALTIAGMLVLDGCAQARNYDDPLGPQIKGGVAARAEPDASLRVVSFNVHYARAIDRVGDALMSEPALREADVILLQETDSLSTARLAARLARAYVYVPAAWHPVSKRDFGNAILSAWPIAQTEKILLPHLGTWRNSRRAAAAATLCVGRVPVRVYAVHLGTVMEIDNAARRDQLDIVLRDAEQFGIAIVGGDFNSGGVAKVALPYGYEWPTKGRGATKSFWSIDHILIRGATTLDAGVAHLPGGVSDHRPVWTTLTRPIRRPDSLAPASESPPRHPEECS